jgi:hypothetical protein
MLSTSAHVHHCFVAIATKPATRQFTTISVVYVLIVLVYCIVLVVGELHRNVAIQCRLSHGNCFRNDVSRYLKLSTDSLELARS